MRIWRCTVCGWLHEGENPPDRCPRCGAPAEKFELVEPLEYAGLMQEDEVADAVEVKEMTAEDKKRIEPALFSISCGLYIVGSVKDGGPTPRFAIRCSSLPARQCA